MQTLCRQFAWDIFEIDSTLPTNDGFELRKFRFGANQAKRVTNMDDRIVFRNNDFSISEQSRKNDPGLRQKRQIADGDAVAIWVGYFQINVIWNLRIGFHR